MTLSGETDFSIHNLPFGVFETDGGGPRAGIAIGAHIVDLAQLARQQSGEKLARGRAAREGDVWEERKFPNFLGAAVWNAISLLAGSDELHRGVEPLKQWLRASSYGDMPEFRGTYAVTLYLLEQAFGKRREDDAWKKAMAEARRAWDLVLRGWRG